MKFSLLTGRSIDQGVGKEHGKLSEEYAKSVAICELNAEDMRKLKIRDGDCIKISTKFGSVVLKAQKSRSLSLSGVIFIPYGPYANLVLPPETDGTGMPLLKGAEAQVELTEYRVLSMPDLLTLSYGKEKRITKC